MLFSLLLGCADPEAALVDWKPDLEVRQKDAALLDRALTARAKRGGAAGEAAGGPRPDIVVIVIDTVRADRLGLYGYAGGTSPKLDAWGAGARVYDRFVADAPWTLPAHASLFTGRWPVAHGAHDRRPEGPLPRYKELVGAKEKARRLAAGDATARTLSDFTSALPAGTPTVAAALRAAGWDTMGIVANGLFVNRRYGLDAGFDVWLAEDLPKDRSKLPYPSGDRVTELALRALGAPAERPRFLFLNYLDAHTPWVPRRGFVAHPDRLEPESLPLEKGWFEYTDRLMQGEEQPAARLASWSEAYDAELRYLDAELGRLLDALPGLGVGPEDWVFVLSDHGEYLGEHGLIEHAKDVYEPVLRVPLLVRGPGVTPGRDATPVQHHDVATMVLAAAGLPPLDGAARTEGLAVSESYYGRPKDLLDPKMKGRFDRVRRAYLQGDHKLILGSDGSVEAYDLAADPGERTPLPDAPWLTPLKLAAEGWERGQVVATISGGLGEDDAEKMRALGYVE